MVIFHSYGTVYQRVIFLFHSAPIATVQGCGASSLQRAGRWQEALRILQRLPLGKIPRKTMGKWWKTVGKWWKTVEQWWKTVEKWWKTVGKWWKTVGKWWTTIEKPWEPH